MQRSIAVIDKKYINMFKKYTDKLLLEDHSQRVNQQAVNEFINYLEVFLMLGLDRRILMDILSKSFTTAEKLLIHDRINFIYELDDFDQEKNQSYPAEAIKYCRELSEELKVGEPPLLFPQACADQEYFSSPFLPEDIILGYDIDMNTVAILISDRESLIKTINFLNKENDLKYYAELVLYEHSEEKAKIVLRPKNN